jgi:hypothetical protein
MESNSDGPKPVHSKTASPATNAPKDGKEATAGPQEPKRVFVVSPIGSPGDDTYKKAAYALKFIFKRALPAPEWDVHRADEGKLSDSIGQHVIRSIMEAHLVIADLTGHNPNVFYELAVAHAARKPVVHLISKGERLPFDVFDQRTIHYDITDLESVEEAVEEVRAYADAVLSKANEVVNPLTNYEVFDRIRAGGASGEGARDDVAELLAQMLARLTNLEQAVSDSKRQQEPVVKNRYISSKDLARGEREVQRLLDRMGDNVVVRTVEDIGRATKTERAMSPDDELRSRTAQSAQ